MAVTKQTYTLLSGWTATTFLDNLLKPALVDAGLMSDWYDSFNISNVNNQFRVMQLQYNTAKTYGTTYYYFWCNGSEFGVAIASGWNTTTHVPTGTQFIDYHLLPTNMSNANSSYSVTNLGRTSGGITNTTSVIIDRYTSQANTKQSWFVLNQGSTGRSKPFAFIHPNTTLNSWVDLDKGLLAGLYMTSADVANRVGLLSFRQQENIRRAFCTGTALRGFAETYWGSDKFHLCGFAPYSYVGLGSENNSPDGNTTYTKNNPYSGFVLPVGKSSVNPAYTSDYIPICTGLSWCQYASEALSSDFAVYMHYANNNIAFQDKFIVSAGVQEWEILDFANNSVVNDGASPMFLARVV